MNQYIFKRFELKYILTKEQYENIVLGISKYLHIDKYGETTIQSLYYDTDTFLLIRTSIERPSYKEKLRIRSYGLANDNSTVFVELKKKYNKIVYKRRIEKKEYQVYDFLESGLYSNNTQIEKEIIYACNYYENLKPRMLLLYDRTAYKMNDSDLRITFDKRPRYRVNDLNLHSNLDGNLILEEDQVIMEIKTSVGYPRWLIDLLEENKAYKTRFSKYGTAYKLYTKNKLLEEDNIYV